MAGVDNLKPLSTEKARKIGSLGGKASGKAKREKKLFRDIFSALLDGKTEMPDGNVLTNKEALAMAQIQKALSGDTKAAEFVRDTLGEKPIEKIEHQTPMPTFNISLGAADE